MTSWERLQLLVGGFGEEQAERALELLSPLVGADAQPGQIDRGIRRAAADAQRQPIAENQLAGLGYVRDRIAQMIGNQHADAQTI